MNARADRQRTRQAVGLVLATGLMFGTLGACSSDNDSASTTTEVARPGETKGEVIGTGSNYQATIRRTTGGVPHITGKTLPDAAFGQGWASGEDRTCDLADQVIKIRGERAQWLGAGEEDANINSDVAWRAVGIYERATADWAKVSDDVRTTLTAYTAGCNAHLKNTGVDNLAGWCKGQPWVKPLKPVDVYAEARTIALSASSARVIPYLAATPPEAPVKSPDATTVPAAPSNLRQPISSLVQPASNPMVAPAQTVVAAPPAAARPAFDADAFSAAITALQPDELGSNGWAIGKDRSTGGGGMLMANPHFPWEGELRFWEVHLTVPGSIDAYGVQLTGLPGIGIGFTKEFGWTHTVSAGNRFTAYKLALKPGSPTTYKYGSEWREMTPTKQTIEVKGADGKVTDIERTTWASHYGPMIDFPGVGWTADQAMTYRDANIDDDEILDQYFGMLQAKSFDEFVNVHDKVNGIPLFNTIATSADGRAWYADTSATPNLSKAAQAAYDASLTTDIIAKVAAGSGAIVLDGSDPQFEWVDEPGARDPGLVPPERQPRVERSDYVFNANDSFWFPHATALLTGDYSIFHGRQGTERSPRTRENATVLSDTSAKGASGADGTFTLDELADAALANRGYTSRVLREDVVKRCQGATAPVAVPELAAVEPAAGSTAAAVPGLPAAQIDIGPECAVLAAWDGVYDLDRVGPQVWREFMARFEVDAVWAVPFDATRPLTTPSGLVAAPSDPAVPDPVLVNLARAAQTLEAAGFPIDTKLGEIQFALRNGKRIPIHGGNGADGTTNVVTSGGGGTIQDPALLDRKVERLVAGSTLSRVNGESGYSVSYGTSFMMALDFTKSGPKAKAFLTYSNTEDRSAKDYLDAT
ncbi:MAG: penicillin acylase family protein, partial [Aquihabitans sp.]